MAVERFGERVTENLHARLMDLISAITVADLQVGSPEPISDNHFKIDIDEQFRILFCPSSPKKTYLPRGHLDWSGVRKIKLIKIEKLE